MFSWFLEAVANCCAQKIDDFDASSSRAIKLARAAPSETMPGWAGEKARRKMAPKGRFYGAHEFCNCLFRKVLYTGEVEEIFGYVENIVFAGESFTVARLKEPRKQELTCIVGPLPAMQPGETIRCLGEWKHHPQYGRQFDVKEFESKEPSDLYGIQKYLESGLIKGIGPAYAERIVQHFGIDTLKIIDSDPRRLSEVAGIGPKRIDMIESCWHLQRGIREVMVFLQSHGVTTAFAQKIYKAYGDQSIEKGQRRSVCPSTRHRRHWIYHCG